MPSARGDVGGHAADAARFDVRRRHVGGPIEIERHGAAGEARGAGHHPRVAGVGDQHVVGAGAFEDLGLGVRDRLDRREVLQVRLGDVGPHAHVGLGDPEQRADLAGRAHPELDDGHARRLAVASELEQRQRQADVVVQVAAVAERPVPQRQERGRDFLGRRLARRSGDGDEAGAALPPHRAAHPLQRERRVGHLDDDRLRLAAGDGVGASGRHHDAARPAIERVADEGVPVVALAGDGDEQLAGDDRARVDAEHAERRLRVAADDAAAGRGGHFPAGEGQGRLTHRRAPPPTRSSSRADRARRGRPRRRRRAATCRR